MVQGIPGVQLAERSQEMPGVKHLFSMTLAHLQDRFSGPGFDLNRLDTRPASHALHRSDAEGSIHAAILSGIVQEGPEAHVGEYPHVTGLKVKPSYKQLRLR